MHNGFIIFFQYNCEESLKMVPYTISQYIACSWAGMETMKAVDTGPSSLWVVQNCWDLKSMCSNTHLRITHPQQPSPSVRCNLSQVDAAKGKSSVPDSYIVVPIHNYEKLLDQCVQLINSEWPRSYSARLWSLKSSKDTLPTSMILIDNNEKESKVLGHAKLSPIPSDPEAAFIETVVVDRSFRGKGLGKFLMIAVENHCFATLNLKTLYLSTIDQEGFYLKLGYKFCKAMNIFGTRSAVNTSTKKIWMMKSYIQWNRREDYCFDSNK